MLPWFALGTIKGKHFSQEFFNGICAGFGGLCTLCKRKYLAFLECLLYKRNQDLVITENDKNGATLSVKDGAGFMPELFSKFLAHSKKHT